MQTTTQLLSPTGPALSSIVAGTMTWGEWGSKYDTATMAGLIDHCLSLGITTFDHADIYGHYSTEEQFGAALATLPSATRDRLQLVTKCGIQLETHRRPSTRVAHYDSSKAHIVAAVERSLRNFGTDRIDLLLIHRPDPLMDPAAVAEAFAELKRAGKVLHFGVSNFTPHQFELLAGHTDLVTNQVECHPLHTDPYFDGTYDQCQARGVAPMVWSPLGGSKYFNGEGTRVLGLRDRVTTIAAKYGVEEDVVLLAWCRQHPGRPIPVVGTTKQQRLTQAIRSLSLVLERQEWYEILEAGRGRQVD